MTCLELSEKKIARLFIAIYSPVKMVTLEPPTGMGAILVSIPRGRPFFFNFQRMFLFCSNTFI